MKFDEFLQNYWNLFIYHISMYHPLDREFINEFKYEIDWYRLSENDKIIWDFDFISEHQNKLQWRSLSANNGVIWNEELIDTFKNRVDWLRLGENNSVPITKDFILKYKKRLKISKYNKYLTEELLSYYDGVLWSPFNDLRRQFEVEDLKDVTAIIQGWRKLFSTVPKKGFYELYILPNVQNLDLFKLFTEKFRYGQRYYSLRPLQLDKYGLTPEFRPEEFIKENIKGKPTTKEFQKITYKSGSQEGPSRMYQIMRLQSMPYIPVILIHENIKTLLDSFSISKHEFIKIEIDPKHFKISQKFYLLYIEFDYALKQLDFDKTEFEIGERDFDTLRSHNYYKGYQKPIKSYEELKSKEEIRPKNIYVKHSYDIFALGREIVVNEYVKNTLEKVLPNIWDFKSLQKYRIQIDQSKYDQKARTYNSHNFSLKPFTYQKKKDYQFYLDKMDRLSRSKIDIDENIISKDEFYEISKKLRITFPNILKKRILNPIQLEDYDIRDINGFETNDFYFQEHPQAYKSILIGDNGCGDSVGLMLKKNSDFELQNKLFEFLHEAGEIREYGTENYI